MKRISLLVVLMVLWANVAFAANWMWSCSSDKVGYFFDTTSVEYDRGFDGKPNYYVIYFWRKDVFTPSYAQELANNLEDGRLASCAYSLSRNSINSYNQTITIYETIYYDEQGNVIYSAPSEEATFRVVPESYGERLLWDIVRYAHYNKR